MDIILVKDHKKGNAGDQIQVRPGYANNFLIPKGIAVMATAANLNRFQGLRRRVLKELAEKKVEFETVAKKIAGIELVFQEKTHGGKLYGSVTPKDVAKRLKEDHGVDLEKSVISMPDHVKALGRLTIALELHPEVSAEIVLDVQSEGEVDAPTDYTETKEGQADEAEKAQEAEVQQVAYERAQAELEAAAALEVESGSDEASEDDSENNSEKDS